MKYVDQLMIVFNHLTPCENYSQQLLLDFGLRESIVDV